MLNNLNRLKLILTGVIILIIAGQFSTINANFATGNYLNVENSDITSGSGVELEIEYWMADASYWSVSPFYEAGESAAELEDWMADASYWSVSPFFEVGESAAEIEEWMSDVLHWNYPEAYHAEENDVMVEDWMIDTGRWVSSFNKCANLPRTFIDESAVYVNDWMMDISRWRKES